MFHFLDIPLKVETATDSVKSTVKKAGHATIVKDDGDSESKTKSNEPSTSKHRRRKVRISAKNLPRVLRNQKRSSVKGKT